MFSFTSQIHLARFISKIQHMPDDLGPKVRTVLVDFDAPYYVVSCSPRSQLHSTPSTIMQQFINTCFANTKGLLALD